MFSFEESESDSEVESEEEGAWDNCGLSNYQDSCPQGQQRQAQASEGSSTSFEEIEDMDEETIVLSGAAGTVNRSVEVTALQVEMVEIGDEEYDPELVEVRDPIIGASVEEPAGREEDVNQVLVDHGYCRRVDTPRPPPEVPVSGLLDQALPQVVTASLPDPMPTYQDASPCPTPNYVEVDDTDSDEEMPMLLPRSEEVRRMRRDVVDLMAFSPSQESSEEYDTADTDVSAELEGIDRLVTMEPWSAAARRGGPAPEELRAALEVIRSQLTSPSGSEDSEYHST